MKNLFLTKNLKKFVFDNELLVFILNSFLERKHHNFLISFMVQFQIIKIKSLFHNPCQSYYHVSIDTVQSILPTLRLALSVEALANP